MNILDAAIGWLAPTTCIGCQSGSVSLCDGCAASSILPFGERCYLCQSLSPRSRTCPRCRQNSPRFVWVSTDYSGLSKELIRVYKFRQQRAAAVCIAKLMAETFERFNDRRGAKPNYLVVPVPTATSRVRQRGFDHSRLLAEHIAGRLGLDYRCPLIRLGQSNQVGARAQERLKQQEGAYKIVKSEKIRGRNILLIDDIVTTGASLRSVTQILRAAGASHVDALVFARNL